MVRFVCHGQTDVGRRRPGNEDSFGIFPYGQGERSCLVIVADGVGGHAAGEVASALAVERISSTFLTHRDVSLADALLRAVEGANLAVFNDGQTPSKQGMSSTAVCAVLADDRLIVANVGDSRLYRIREAEIEQLTLDHSWVEEQVRAGAMSAEEAHVSTYRHLITRGLGLEPTVKIDLTTHAVEIGDVYLLCSDGLSGFVSDIELRDIAWNADPTLACSRLVDRANQHGGGDNITAVIVAVRSDDWDESQATIREERSDVASRATIPETVTWTTPAIAPEQPVPFGDTTSLDVSSVRDQLVATTLPEARHSGWSLPGRLWLILAVLAVLLVVAGIINLRG